jgi:peptidoglycan/LPS O-acetylase OafA/YrhL
MSVPGNAPRQIIYLPVIDGLRAIAVLSVVAFHIGVPGMSGGFAGVDVFFVISGYLITRLLQKEFHARGTLSLTGFYARRVRRLLPALATVLLVTTLAGAFILFPDELPRLRSSANATALAFSNLHFMQAAGGYFDPMSETMPLLHTWSLGVEEQYYFVWPLMLFILGKMGSREHFDRRLLVALILILLVSYATCLRYSFLAPEKAFYLMPLRAWELACGGLIQLLEPRFKLGRGSARLLIWAGFATMMSYIVKPEIAQPFPGVGALLPVIGCAAILLGQAHADTSTSEVRLLGSWPLRTIGLLSYSWYLWHWPMLALSRAYFMNTGGLERNIPLMIGALGLAALTYRYVEKPVRHSHTGPFASERGALATGAALMAVVLGIGSAVIHVEREAGERITEQWSKTLGDPPFGMSKCGEVSQVTALPPASECTYGPNSGSNSTPNSAPNFVIWGDSHAGALTDMADEFANRTHGAVLMRVAASCPALPGTAPFDRGQADMSCAQNNQLVEQELIKLAASGTRGVLLASRWNSYVASTPTDPGGGHFKAILPVSINGGAPSYPTTTSGLEVGLPPLDNHSALVTMETSLRSTLSRLNEAGLRTIIMAPVPELPFIGPHCLFRRSAKDCVISRSSVDARRAPVMALLNRLAADMPNLRIWDPIDEFCDASLCYTYRNGLLLYGDDDHVSRQMARHLYDRNQDLFRWLVATH